MAGASCATAGRTAAGRPGCFRSGRGKLFLRSRGSFRHARGAYSQNLDPPRRPFRGPRSGGSPPGFNGRLPRGSGGRSPGAGRQPAGDRPAGRGARASGRKRVRRPWRNLVPHHPQSGGQNRPPRAHFEPRPASPDRRSRNRARTAQHWKYGQPRDIEIYLASGRAARSRKANTGSSSWTSVDWAGSSCVRIRPGQTPAPFGAEPNCYPRGRNPKPRFVRRGIC